MQQGDELPRQTQKRHIRFIPESFYDDCNISRRYQENTMQICTHGSNGLLKALPKFKPPDAYAMIGITKNDLYPADNLQYCYGWSSY